MSTVRRSALALVVLALVLGAPLPAGAAIRPGPDRSVEDVIDREMAASGVPGLAYVVVAVGVITSAGARGVLRAGGDDSVTPDTAFPTGSILKSFTALPTRTTSSSGEWWRSWAARSTSPT